MIIENEFLKVEVTLNGGNLTSIFDKKNNNELLYQMDERSWMGQDVVIFPVVARLKDGCYSVSNKDYFLKKHGIIRYSKLEVIKHDLKEIVLGYHYNDDSLKLYPYKFNFEVCYKLNNNELIIEYKVYNLDDKTIYFSVGGHPAIKVNGFEDNSSYIFENVKLVLDKKYNVSKYILNESGSFIVNKIDDVLEEEFIMSKDLIDESKTLIYDVENIKEITLESGGERIIFDISQAPILAIWTKSGFGDFLCVEPWWGLPDFENPNKELKDKPLINSLNINDVFTTFYKMRFEV